MTDLEVFVNMLKKANVSVDVSDKPFDDFSIKDGVSYVRIEHGYQCHCEAVFDKDGNMLMLGQYEDM